MKNWFDLAKEAGVTIRGHYDESGITPAELVRLCELVAEEARQEYEREHCRHVVPLPDALQAMIDAEREACAKVCETLGGASSNWHAEAIRARGGDSTHPGGGDK